MALVEKKRWGFLGLPFTFTTYTVAEDILTIDRGFFKRIEDDCYMYKIQDVQLTSGFFERMFGMGTVICYTGDTTDPVIKLIHIKHSREVKDYILEYSEVARRKRRTMNMLDIGANGDMDLDGDGIPD